MSNWIFSFEIDNNQEDYANCMKFVDWLQGGYADGGEIDKNFMKKIRYFESDSTLASAQILALDFKEFSRKKICWSQGDEIQLILWTDCSNENDMINLIYFCLVNDRFGDKCMLFIRENNDRQWKDILNIRDLFSNLTDENVIQNCYISIKGKYERIQSNQKSRRLKRFSPIYQISEEKDSATYWRQSMHTFLMHLYRTLPYGKNCVYMKNYFLPHIAPKEIEKEFPQEKKIEKKGHAPNELAATLVSCFCTGEGVGIEKVRNRYRMWKSRELYELVKDIPLLAMYIFCVLHYFSESDDADSMENIEEEVFNARDMADGLLQILENIYHSENQKGYFCFRVHNDSEERSAGYLKKNYERYMKQEAKKSERAQNYLEVKVADFSHQTIPQTFYEKFVTRMETAEAEDKIKYKCNKKSAGKLNVNSFFKSNKFWKTYNSVSENVVHHYGLQVFDSLVTCYEGYFRLRSQEEYTLKNDGEVYSSLNKDNKPVSNPGIPGTQYDILIPFKSQKLLSSLSLNVNINYIDYLTKKYRPIETIDFTSEACKEIFTRVNDNIKATYQEKKERTIREMEVRLDEKISGTSLEEGEEIVLYFSATQIAITMTELFCKAIMLYIAGRKNRENCYIMIADCTQSHFVEITRMFALFYDKQGNNSLMDRTQIFLSGEKAGEEFLISGSNLGEVTGRTEKLAFARCVHPECLRILKIMLNKRNIGIVPNDMVSIVPFDMISFKGQPTVFERTLKSVLEQDVQSEEFGCKLEGLHVRIGSKIHIRTFYEAELMFHNNYYTSRFAYWLLNEIVNNKEIDFSRPITLVGCENYSEMLLNEVRAMFYATGKQQIDYIIYEQKALEKFRIGRSLSEYKDHQFIFIVPINSTSTTHIKLSGFLKKAIRAALKEKNDPEKDTFELKKNVNYGIILISGTEGDGYWERKEGEPHKIHSLMDDRDITFYMEVSSKWSYPLECEACFPKDDYTKEIPLVETNKESVVPMQAIGIKKKGCSCRQREISEDEIRKLKELSRLLVYDHIERNGNHYSYYFSMEKLWDYDDIRQNVRYWLERQKRKLPREKCKVYDIIVAPLHFSNVAFVEEVNNSLFKSAALVLHFDIDKEFRMNVKAKYSNVQQLYNNLCEDAGQRSVINFHYVDDTIVSGQTFYRMKSLMQSLISTRENSKVEINIFKSVILLISRLSLPSIRNYMDNSEFFMSYFNLNISSMRVNADACVLCKKNSDWNRLADQASLNDVYLFWKEKCRKIKCKPIEEINKVEAVYDGERMKRARQYMIASHKAKTLLDGICNCCTNEEIRKMVIENLLLTEDLDNFIAMLKVLGRPFLSFRKEIKEVTFEIMLLLLEILLGGTVEDIGRALEEYIARICTDEESKTRLIVILINRLVELESNYIIRKHNMERLVRYASSLKDENVKKDFLNNYLNRIKQLVGQSNDFAKCLYLEFLLLYDEEYNMDYTKKEFITLDGDDEFVRFKRKAYLENTKVIDYGITALAEYLKEPTDYDEVSLKDALNDNYYLDNTIEYLAFHKGVVISDHAKRKVEKFATPQEAEKIAGMVHFQQLYENVIKRQGADDSEELQDTFRAMMDWLEKASGAEDGDIIVPYTSVSDQKEKYISLELCQKSTMRQLVNNEQELSDFIKNNSNFEGNTFSIRQEKEESWILLRFCDVENNNQSNISVIFMMFHFNGVDMLSLLHSLKNILVFRHKIWQVLNLSSSTLLQNWTDNLFYKQQMLKPRAPGHSDFEGLEKELKSLVKSVSGESEIMEKQIKRKYLSLIINNMIGLMNTQVLGGKLKEDVGRSRYSLGELWRGEEIFFRTIEKLWEMKLIFSDGEELKKKLIRSVDRERQEKYYPELAKMRILLFTILQNAYKHGKRNAEGCIDIHIYEAEGGVLCVSNEVKAKLDERAVNILQSGGYREGIGISQAVIFDACNSWYPNIQFEKMFEQKDVGQKRSYTVRLPILENGVNNL